jgi:nitrogen fixation NifU-like protein
MSDLYSELILEHSKYPSNYGTLDTPSVSHEENNPLCGDTVRLELLIEDDIITEIRFTGKGCAISQASTSMLTEVVKGMTIEEAKAYSKDDLLDLIGIPLQRNPVRLKCALLPLKVLKVGLYGTAAVLDDDLA